MGLRCSILGHTFDETEVRRDRRERGSGNEVVTVVAQVERCSRCGTERVVSENKEVVSVVDADEVGLEPDEDEGAAGVESAEPPADTPGTDSSGPAPPGDPAAGPGSDSGTRDDPDIEESGSSADPETDPEPTPDSDPGPDPDPESGSAVDPSEEDVEFITETEGSLGGGGDVADDEDVPSDAEAPGDATGGIGGMAARSGAFGGDTDGSDGRSGGGSAEDDAEILDESESERAPGQWPDEPEEEEPWEPGSFEGRGTDPVSESDPDPEVEPVADSSFTVPEGSLKCPDCGYEVSAASSFRAGDACPECQTGYLEAGGGG